MRIDELSMQQERNPTSVSQLLTQFQDLQNTVNSLSDARECFYDPATARSSGASHVPSQPLIIPSPREVRSRDSGWPRDTRFIMGTSVERKQMLSRDSGLPHDTRNVMSTSGNVFESLPAREGPSSAIFENSRNLAITFSRIDIRKYDGTWKRVRRDPQSYSTLTPRFNQGAATLNPYRMV